MDESIDNFFKVIEIIKAESKANLLLFTMPLIALLAQSKLIISIDSLIIKICLSISVVALFLGVFISLQMQSFVRSWHAKELLLKPGEIYKGQRYLGALDNLFQHGKLTLDEDGLLFLSTILKKPILGLLLLGWIPLIVVIFVFIWK